jgi:hypothetical protein
MGNEWFGIGHVEVFVSGDGGLSHGEGRLKETWGWRVGLWL